MWYSYGANLIGQTDKQVRLAVVDGSYAIVIGDNSSSWSYGQVVLRKIQNGGYYQNVMNVYDGYIASQTTSLSASWISGDLRRLVVSGVITANGGNSGEWNTAYSWGNHASAGYLTSVPAQSQLISPNGATVVAADSAMPNAGHSFIHTLAYGPGGNDGHILGMSWASTTSVYGAQIFLDTDPNDIMAIRSRSNAGVWTSWKTVIHSGTIGSQSVSYATTAGALTSMNISQFSNNSGYIAAGSTVSEVAAQGSATRFKSIGDISQGAGNHSLQIFADVNNDAFMAFHISNDYAVHFGLDDSTNRLFVGGWSDGTGNKYQIWDSRDFSSTNISNWNTAYGWGNHASAGYQSASTAITTSNIGSQSVTYATNSTRLYASDGSYVYGGAAPYYMYMNYDGGSYWELKVSPATPGAVRVAYANSAGSASTASTAGYSDEAKWISYPDGPRDLSDRLPNWNNRSVAWDFVGAGTANGSGNYGGVMTFSPWDGTSASTGDSSYQLAFANATGVNASGQPKLSIRNGINSTWNAWYTLVHSGNVGDQSVSFATTAGALSSMNISQFTNNSGYITGYTETDTLGTVTNRGNSTSQNLVFSNGRKGLVGVYNAAQTQAIFAMGAAYVLTDGGGSATMGDHYGLAWSYNPNYGGSGNNPQSKAGLEHQLLVMNAGVTLTALGAGIWTSGLITTTSYGTSSNWNTAYGWGNHASAGYITGNQTITLSGDVSGSGTTSIVVTVNNIDGWGFVNTGSNSPTDADAINSNGISYYTAGVTNFSGNATDGALYSQRYSDSWQHQIAGDYRSGMIAVRGKNNGTWTSWKTIIDSSTIGSQSVSYATSAGSASSATIASTVTVNSGNTSAAWYPIVWHSGNTVYSSSGVEIYAAGNYIRCQYINTTDNDESGITRFVIKNGDSYHRSATTTVAADIIRGVASGTWSINVTGSAGSAGSATSATQVVTIQDNPPTGVNGKLWWESDTGKLKVYYGTSSAWVDATPVPDMSLYYAKAGGPISGDVTIQQTLTVVGNTLIQGTLTETSDISLKENILPLESSLDKVMKLNGVSFNKKATPNVKEIGFIAQEVEAVIPDLVTETNEGIKTVSYSRVTAVLVETIKEQQAQINTQQSQIEELKNMVNMLAEKLNSL